MRPVHWLILAVIGLLAHKHIKALLFSPLVVAASLVIGGVILIVTDSEEAEEAQNSAADAAARTAEIGARINQTQTKWREAAAIATGKATEAELKLRDAVTEIGLRCVGR